MAGSKGKRGGQGGSATAQQNRELTDAEMERELQEHFKKVNALLDRFMAQRGEGQNLEAMDTEGVLDAGFVQMEKHNVKDIVKTYIDDFNDNVEKYGDGFEYYDPDQTISILYRNGKQVYIGVDWWDGKKKIPTANIDSVIVDGGWGTAVAGKNVQLVNYREATDYGRYGYRNVRARYDDWDDIRAEFK